MLALLNPVLVIFHFITNAAHYILVVSFLVGQGIYFALIQICTWIGVIFQGIAVVFDELWLFIWEVHLSINDMCMYIENSTNRGVGGVLDGFSLFVAEMGRFFTNGKVHSKLLASAVGRWITNFFVVIHGGLLLIADSVWFLLTIIPKTLLQTFIYIGDVIVFGIDGTWKLILSFAQNVIDELFRYTIAVVVIFLILRNRRRLHRATRLWAIRIVRTTIRWSVRIFRFLFVLRSAQQQTPPAHNWIVHPTRQRSPIQQRSSSSVVNKSNESICCVVCRDRPKCVLLLPCKHLCMCEECAEFIATMRQAFCPLCRSTVHKQLSVYI